MGAEWYVLRSKPRKEDALYRQVELQGFDAYYPRFEVDPVNPRSKKVRPFFPGYLFVNADIDQTGMSTFQWMPNAIGLVHFGGVPGKVSEDLIRKLKSTLQEVNQRKRDSRTKYNKGDSVRIRRGPFEGFEAIFDIHLRGQDRVRVLMKLLNGRFGKVDLDSEYLERC
jgi:transcriptional antiterminator RfaH